MGAATAELERAYRDNRGRFLVWARTATRSLLDAEDLVQESFAAALSRIDALAAVEDPAAWLFTVLRNRVRDLWRHREAARRAGEAEVSSGALGEIAAVAGLDPADIAEDEALAKELSAAIRLLPPAQRRVIEGQVFKGLSCREIAEREGVAEDTVAARKRYALKKLSAALGGWKDD